MPLRNGEWEIVQGLEVNEFAKEKIEATVNELREERDAVAKLESDLNPEAGLAGRATRGRTW